MRADRIVLVLACLLGSCGARGALEVDPPPDGGPRFDTFTCRWSWGRAPWRIAPTAAAPERAVLHSTADVGAFTAGEQFFGFDLTPPPEGTTHGIVRAEAIWANEPLLAWPHGPGWHLLGGTPTERCHAEAWSVDLWTPLEEQDYPGGPRCGYDPIGTEAARITWGESVEVFAVGEGLDGPRIASLPVAGELAPRVAREPGGTLWVATIAGGEVTLHAVRDAVVIATASLGRASVAPPLAPDRLRGGVIAAMWDASALRLVRVSMGASGLELLELAAVPADPGPPTEIATTEAEILFARADGSFTSVPLSGAPARPIAAPEPGASRGALAMREGTSFGYAVYSIGVGGVGETRMRPLDCNR